MRKFIQKLKKKFHSEQPAEIVSDQSSVKDAGAAAVPSEAAQHQAAPDKQVSSLQAIDLPDNSTPLDASIMTEFQLKPASAIQHAEIAGSFNDWQPASMALDPEFATWIYRLDLKPGTYQYKFIMDGQWVIDPDNPELASDDEGNTNSVIHVEAARVTT